MKKNEKNNKILIFGLAKFPITKYGMNGNFQLFSFMDGSVFSVQSLVFSV